MSKTQLARKPVSRPRVGRRRPRHHRRPAQRAGAAGRHRRRPAFPRRRCARYQRLVDDAILQVTGVTNPLGLGFDAQAARLYPHSVRPSPSRRRSPAGRGRLRRHHGRAIRRTRRACPHRPPAFAGADEPHPQLDGVTLTESFLYLFELAQAGLRLGQLAGTADVRLEGVTSSSTASSLSMPSLEVEHGRFFALLDRPRGKTTSLRMIAGFEDPNEGRIFLGDRDVVGLPPYKRATSTRSSSRTRSSRI